MPLYEFRCEDCGARVTLLVGMTADSGDQRCDRCGGIRLNRLVSRFRVGRDEDARIEEVVNRAERMGEPESGTELLGMMREMGKAMDEDYSDEMEQIFETDIADP